MIQIHRYEDQIRAYEQYPIETGKVLLYGSSFFANWGYERAKKQWFMASEGKLDVVNHGFGGATVEELLYHYNRLVLPYTPSAAVFRTGHNDVWIYSPQDAFFLTQRLFDWFQNDFLGIPLIALKAFDHPSALPRNREALHRYNEMLDALSQTEPAIHTVDLNPFFYDAEGNFRDVFCEDGLHLTDSGYEQMAAYLVPKIESILSK